MALEDKVTAIRIMQSDGTLSEKIPIGAEAQNVDMANEDDLQYTIEDIYEKLKEVNSITSWEDF